MSARRCRALPRQLDFHGDELAIVDKELAAEALSDPVVARLMTILDADAIAGISIVAAVGDFSRFADPGKLVAYVGLNPRVPQSGNTAPVRGRQPSKPNAPTKSSSPTGSHENRLVRGRPLDDFIRRAQDLADLDVVVQERDELLAGGDH